MIREQSNKTSLRKWTEITRIPKGAIGKKRRYKVFLKGDQGLSQEAAKNPEVDDGWRRVTQVCEQHSGSHFIARARKVTDAF